MEHILRKKVLFTTLFALLLGAVGATKSYAVEFFATSPSGHEIKYQIISSDAKTVRTIRYRYNNDQLYIYNGNLVIPSTVTYQNEVYSVIEIGGYTFMDQTLLTSVEIPSSVTTIDYSAFKNCTGLTGTLTIGENIVSIGSEAFNNTNYSTLNYNAINCTGQSNFSNCAPNPDDTNEKNGWIGDCPNLTTLHIGENVVNLPGFLFAYCNFTGTLTIPNTVTSIGWKTFYHCQDFSGRLTIPESVTTIVTDAFAYCTGFTELYFNAINFEGEGGSYNPPEENVFFGNCTSLTTLVIGENVQSIGPHSFVSCHFTNHVIIPNSVTNIGYDAFRNCTGIIDVTIGEGVTSIGGNAFNGCTNLATVNYNAVQCNDFGTHSDRNNAVFDGCTALTTLNIGSSVEVIPSYAFSFCAFSGSIIIPNSVTRIGGSAFYKCTNITSVTLGEGLVTVDGDYMGYGNFKGCTSLSDVTYNAVNCTNWNNSNIWTDCNALTTLTIGPNVQYLPANVFEGCSFTSELVFPSSLVTIGSSAFKNCSGLTGDLIIPENVTTIGGNAFNGCSGFTGDLTIGNSVETIGEYAFANCTGLQGTLTIGESFSSSPGTWGKPFDNCSGLTTLNYNAINASLPGWYWLNGCTSLTTLNIGPNVQVIPERAFMNLNFSNDIVIPNTVTTIGYQAFYNCDQITTITIGEGVTSMASSAIYECDGLTTVNYNAVNCNVGNTTINSGWLSECPNLTTLTIGNHVQSIFKGAFKERPFTGNLVLPNSLVSIGEEAFYQCTGFTGNLTIPNSVTSLGKKAFYKCSGFDGNLIVGNGVTAIDEQTFYQCNSFTGTLTLGSDLVTIGSEAFKGCSGFTGDLTIPNSVTTLGRNCFDGCSGFDGTLTVGESVVAIDNYAPFNNCSSLTAINYNAINAVKPDWGNWLSGCNALATLTIGPNVESIFESAFDGKSCLTGSLEIPNSVTTVGKNAFKGCSGFNGTLTLSNNLSSVGEAAFKDCYGFIGSLTLSNSLTTIDKEVFRNCHSFTGDLVIPNTVLTIGDDAFRDCYGMDGVITIGTGVTSIGQGAFQNCNKITTLNYNAINATVTNDSWISYCNLMTTLNLGNQVQSIPADAFKNRTNFTGNLTLPNSLTSIGDYAFYHDRYFTGDLVIPSGVTTIGQYAFEECQGFTGTLTLPATMTSIGEAAFKNCYNFTGSLTIPAGLTTIEKEAFREMRSLTGDLVIPNSVVEIKQQAFINCRSLNGTLTLSSSLESIGQEAFQDCNSLTGDLTLPSTLTTIGIRAFKSCRGFTGDLVIPNSVTSLPNGVFNDCSGLNGELIIGESMASLDDECFYKAQNFQSMTVRANTPPEATNNNVFGYWDKTKPVYIPCGASAAYQEAECWSDFTNYIESPMIDLQVSSADPSMGTASITQQATCSNNQATVTAVANSGYMFSNWTEGEEIVSTSNPYSFNLTANRNLVAHFEGVTYTINATANPFVGGTITGTGSFGEGATAILTATANTGYTFVNWTEGNEEVSTDASFTFTVMGDRTLAANFSLNSYAISAVANPTAGGSVTGADTYNHGTTATLTATANTGYSFVNWTQGGVEVSAEATYSFTVTEAADFVANFSLNSYQITATANPSAGGVVNGGGTYDHGTTCTLTASPNQGYRFVNWTENDVEVSTDASYSFTVSGVRTLVANFEEITLHWTPIGGTQYNMTVKGIIVIDGVTQENGQLEIGAFCGDECRGSRLASAFPLTGEYTVMLTVVSNVSSGETITFRIYDHGLGEELDLHGESTLTFEHNTNAGTMGNWYPIAFTSAVTVTTPLSQGWNWWSTYIEQSNIDGLSMLEESLGHNGLTIKTQNAFTDNYYGDVGVDYWYGSLESLSNEQGYLINVSSGCDASMTGVPAKAADHPITILPNWNWIGYPVATAQNVATALSGFSPSPDDALKGQSVFTSYYEGYGWYPDDFMLVPGQSYLYCSNATGVKTLTYAEGSRGMTERETKTTYWKPEVHKHPGNIVVTATVERDGETLEGDGIELGAFVNGECRGTARLRYFGPTGRWYAMLTVTGEEGETVTFSVIDRTTGEVRRNSTESVAYRDNAVVGTLGRPFEVHFGNEESLHVYPNPVARDASFTLELPGGEEIREVTITNALGVTVRREATTSLELRGLKTAGVYTVKATCKSGNAYVGRVLVK